MPTFFSFSLISFVRVSSVFFLRFHMFHVHLPKFFARIQGTMRAWGHSHSRSRSCLSLGTAVSSSTCDDRQKAGRKFLDGTQQDTTSWGTSGTSETYGDNNHHFGGSERTVISWYISYTDDPTGVLFSRFIFSPEGGMPQKVALLKNIWR